MSDESRHGLAAYGYRQRLDRSLGQFATFAAAVSFISILTGIFQLFYVGAFFAGPGFWWGWVAVFAGQMCVCLLFAEIAGRYPIAGSTYNWTKRLAGSGPGWFAGWMACGATIVGVASVALAMQVVLPQINSDFQLVGDGTGKYDVSTNAVILGTVLIIVACIVNSLGVRVLTRINSTGVALELTAAVLLIVLLLVNAERGPDVVFETNGTGAGHDWGYFGALLLGSLVGAYTLWGFDTASSLGEETNDPRRNAPKSVIRALAASGLIGAALILAAWMAVPDIASEELAAGGLPYVVKAVFGGTMGTLLLWAVVIAIVVCLMSIMAAATRFVFAMARDNALPRSSVLAKVSPRSTPVLPNVVVSALAIALLIINIRQPQIIVVVVTLSIILMYVSYLITTIALLVARLRGRWTAPTDSFSLGRWGLVLNVIAILWGAASLINLAWPRKDIYNPVEPFHWYLQYGAIVFIGLFAAGGAAYYFLVARQKIGVLDEHRAEATDAVPEAPPYRATVV